MGKILSKLHARSTLSGGGNARRCHLLTHCKSTVLSAAAFWPKSCSRQMRIPPVPVRRGRCQRRERFPIARPPSRDFPTFHCDAGPNQEKFARSVEAALLARRLVADYFEGAHRARGSRRFTGIYATSLGLARGRK